MPSRTGKVRRKGSDGGTEGPPSKLHNHNMIKQTAMERPRSIRNVPHMLTAMEKLVIYATTWQNVLEMNVKG